MSIMQISWPVTASDPAPAELNPSNQMLQPDDVATLVVNGEQFNDWESVVVVAEHFEAASHFRFTAAERQFPPGALRQFGPGDRVAIYLGNSLAIDGFLELRQIAYDVDNHAVELAGVNATGPVMRSSVDTKTGSFDGMTFQQVATKVLSQYNIGFKIVGALNPLPFIELQNQPGEPVWDFLERLARVRGIAIGNDSFSNFLAVGQHAAGAVTALIEGVNIKRCSAVYHKTHSFVEIETIGQKPAHNASFGTDASEQWANWRGPGYYPSSKIIVPAEQPVAGVPELQDRAKWEALWQSSDEMRVFITVAGWYRAPGKLWWPLDEVSVVSPFIPMDSTMTIKSATFKQSRDGGTETEIELRFPWGLNSMTPVGPITGPSTENDPNKGQLPGPVAPGTSIPPIP